ncbi:MAG: type VI secretion system baseplate subunit TssG, partial [Geobacter sp.]|nr:type VI secretion system baseplate subunit TssG [Geobacter sp.]
SHFYECRSKFRVKLGPMGYKNFLRLLPSGSVLASSFSMIKYMTGREYEFDVSLILKRDEIPPCILGQAGLAPQLGWTTWIKSEGMTHDYDPCVTFAEGDVNYSTD